MWWLLGLIVFFVLIYKVISFVLRKFFKHDYLESQLGALALSIVIITAFGYIDMANQKYEYYNTRSIVAMQDSQTYVVSRYNADSEMRYYYLYETGNETYRSSYAPSNRSSIHVTDSDKGYKVDIYKKQKKIKFFKLILPKEYVDAYRYDFYIPKDGLVSEFKVDLN